MIIRATTKLHNIARMKPVKNDTPISAPLPGEWYASLLSTGRQGKSAIHFLHNPTMVTILVPGRSLTKAIQALPVRMKHLLERNGFAEMVPSFALESETEIYATSSRHIIANMTQMRLAIEFQLRELEEPTHLDVGRLEDHYLDYLVGGRIAGKNNYITPQEQLTKLLS